ncbi:hypothetical protein VNI00_007466 [Paramarasmius palmivorus]|uniref:F-box domain-containing protein n=1 Tax=Paramarasmius palmivorus TaxID=297713 RepID=A0AAW0D427_9AGAR
MAGVKLSLHQLVNALMTALHASSKENDKISISEIDELERKLQIAASVLRGLRNSLQPVNRLPPEILSDIFMLSKQHLPSFLPLVRGGIRYFENHSWLAVLHVCRHWRGVVARCPALWGTIDNLRGGVCPQTCLKRSRGAPVDVFLSITGPEFKPIQPELVDALIPHIPRFRQFHVNTDGWFDPTPIYASLKESAPNLTSLSIVTKGRDVVGGVLPAIFNDHMPQLRQLTLEHFTSWPATYFTNLTHCCLFDQWDATATSRPTTSQFLDFLASSPGLEELALVRAGPTRLQSDDFPSVSPPSRIVELPKLKELSIGDWPSSQSIARLLSHLSLPSTTQMYFWGQQFPTGGSSDTDAITLASFLPSDLSHIQPLLDLREIWITRMPDTWARGECPFVAVLNQTLYLWGFYTAQEMQPLVDKLPLENVERLQLRDCFTYPERVTGEMWGAFFRRMERLEKLTILARDCPIVTRAVLGVLRPKKEKAVVKDVGDIEKAESVASSSNPKTKQGAQAEGALLCPRLSHIRIEDNPHVPTLFISSLAKHRRRRGAPIKTLEVLYFDAVLNRPHSAVSDSASSDSESSDDEYKGFTLSDMKLLEKYIDKVILDTGKHKLADVGPKEWPNQVFRWTLPTRVPPS